jgi:hypothetical protein
LHQAEDDLVEGGLGEVHRTHVGTVQDLQYPGQRYVGVLDDEPDAARSFFRPFVLTDFRHATDFLQGMEVVSQVAWFSTDGQLDELALEGPVPQLVGGSDRDEGAAGQEAHAVAQLGLPDVLGGDEERAILLAQPPELLPEPAAEDGVEVDRQLVDEEKIGLVDGGRREL